MRFRSVKIVWFLLVAALLVGSLCIALNYEAIPRRQLTILATDAFEEILSSQKQIERQAGLCSLYNYELEAAYTNGAYLISAPASKDAAIDALSYLSAGYRATFVPDDAFSDFEDAVAKNHSFQILITNGRRYYYEDVVFTTLPVITLQTDGANPRRFFTDKTYAALSIVSPDGACIERFSAYRLRGSSSSSYEKPSYHLTLYRNDGARDETSLLNLGQCSEWNLLSLYSDSSRMREKISLDLWNDVATTNPLHVPVGSHTAYCELIKDGQYVGLYALAEQIDATLLGIDSDPDARLYKIVQYATETFLEKYDQDQTAVTDIAEIKYPASDVIETDWQPFYQYFDSFYTDSKVLSVEDIESLVDLSNSIDYFLFVSASGASDNVFKNEYLIYQRDTDGMLRFHVVPHDLDLSFGNLYTLETDIHSVFTPQYAFEIDMPADVAAYLAADPISAGQRISSRWTKLRETLFSEASLSARFQTLYLALSDSGVLTREAASWPNHPPDEDLLPIYDFISTRLNFLDAYFADLANP